MAALLAAALSVSIGLHAQQRGPTIGYVYPAGGKQGTSFDATIRGQFLDRATNVIVSGEGVRATVLDFYRPIDGKTRNLMRDREQNIRDALKASKSGDSMVAVKSELNEKEIQRMYRAAAEKELADIKMKLSDPKTQQRAPNPQLSQEVNLRITISPGATPGDRELRLLTAAGLSNPVMFKIGQLPEFSRKAEFSLTGPGNPNVDLARIARLSSGGRGGETEQGMRVTIPCVINGQVMPATEDRFRFAARAGQQLVIAASARELIPYIADAVPGWFQATLGLFDAKGKELAYDDDFKFHPDPVLYYVIPREGDYEIRIKDSIYRGREDFVYRITVGELPFITSIFPLGGKLGETVNVTMTGWNLGVTNQEVKFNETGIQYVGGKKGEVVTANRVPFMVDTLPEVMEKEPNDLLESAQRVTLPVVINGRVDLPGDVDVYRFEGKAGQNIVAEVYARRLDSPLDSVLKLTDQSGKQLAFNDDHEDRGTGLNTHHADSYLTATLPSDGSYYIYITDPQRVGGPDYGYRLRLSAPRPDFALRLVPATINARAGSTTPVTVYAMRRDGFNGDISLAFRNAPEGFKLNNSRIPGSTNAATFSISVPNSVVKNETLHLSLEGKATINGKPVVHPAVPSSDMMQAFAYRHLVPAQDLDLVAVGGGGGGKGAFAANKGGNKGKGKTKN